VHSDADPEEAIRGTTYCAGHQNSLTLREKDHAVRAREREKGMKFSNASRQATPFWANRGSALTQSIRNGRTSSYHKIGGGIIQ